MAAMEQAVWPLTGREVVTPMLTLRLLRPLPAEIGHKSTADGESEMTSLRHVAQASPHKMCTAR